MRPWASWLLDHRMGWTFYGIWFVSTPVIIALAVWVGVKECASQLKDVRRILKL